MFTLLSLDSFILTGENVRRWCNGMFSNNIRALQPFQGKPSAMCDDRGRIIGFVDTYCIDDTHFQCVLNGSSLDWFQTKFKMVLFLDDIEVEEEQEGLIHIFGPQSVQIFEQLHWNLASDRMYQQFGAFTVLSNNRFQEEGFDIIAEPQDLKQLQEQLLALGEQEIDEITLENLRIQRNIPKYPNDFTDKSFIHEYGLDKTHCAFNKGCYVGQEIINRMDLKQLAPRKLCLLKIEGSAQVGMTLQVDSSSNTVGEISSLSQSIPQFALAVMKKNVAVVGSIFSMENGTASIEAVVD